ncbi:MAG: transposase [Verrucomicrobiota bacterium]
MAWARKNEHDAPPRLFASRLTIAWASSKRATAHHDHELLSVRSDGTTACMTIEGSTNTEVFRAYVKEILLPTLGEGDIVVTDNFSAHKNKQTIAIIQSVGATAIFLPPYSPDLNPIELMWSKVKPSLRSTEARTHEALPAAIGSALS